MGSNGHTNTPRMSHTHLEQSLESPNPDEEILIEFGSPQLVDDSASSKASNDGIASHNLSGRSTALFEGSSDNSQSSDLPPPKTDQVNDLEALLDSIHPPIEWVEEGKHYIRYISRVAAPPSKAVELQYRLLNLLKQKECGHSQGLNPIRRDLFDDCFDELIRQIALDNPGRADILLSVRDELLATRRAYWELFVGSECMLFRKCVRGSSHDLVKNINILKADVANVTKMLDQLQTTFRNNAVKHGEEMEELDRKRNEELDFCKVTNNRLKSQIDKIGSRVGGLDVIIRSSRPSKVGIKHHKKSEAAVKVQAVKTELAISNQ